MNSIHTGLGEEGAETLIRICGFAFFGEVAIGLGRISIGVNHEKGEPLTWIPCSRQ